MSARRILVVFYSRSGHTATVAGDLETLLDADLEELVDTRRRKGVLGYLRAGLDAKRGRQTVLGPLRRDPSGYDLVVIGTPVWASAVSCAVRTFLAEHRDGMAEVAFFLTHGGSGAEKVFGQMEALIGRAPVARLAVRERDLVNGGQRALVERFVQELRAPGSHGPEAEGPGRAQALREIGPGSWR